MARDVEEDGGRKVGTPMTHDCGDCHALLVVDRGAKGTTNAPGIVPVRPFPRPLLPALPNINVGVPHTMEPPSDPRLVYPPLFWWGNTNPMYARTPNPRSSCVAIPSPSPGSLSDILPYGLATVAMTSPPPFSTSGNPMLRSVTPSDPIIAVDEVSAPSRPVFPCPTVRRGQSR